MEVSALLGPGAGALVVVGLALDPGQLVGHPGGGGVRLAPSEPLLPGVHPREVLVSTACAPGHHAHQVIVLARGDAVAGAAGDQGAARVALASILAALSPGGDGAQHARGDRAPVCALALGVGDHLHIHLAQHVAGGPASGQGAPTWG